MSTLSIFTYLLAVWKAAAIYGPSFPNRGSDASCQQHFHTTWPVSLCTSQEGNGSRTVIVSRHVCNIFNAAHTPKDAHWRRERAASSPTWLSSRERKVWKGRTWPSTPSQPHSRSVVKPTLAFCLEGATGGLCEDHGDGSRELHVHVGEDMFGKSILLRNSQGHEDLFEWSKEGKVEWGCGTCNRLQNDTGRGSLSLRVSSGSQPLAQLEQEKFGAFESWTGP